MSSEKDNLYILHQAGSERKGLNVYEWVQETAEYTSDCL